jgi:hypothetical protein
MSGAGQTFPWMAVIPECLSSHDLNKYQEDKTPSLLNEQSFKAARLNTLNWNLGSLPRILIFIR